MRNRRAVRIAFRPFVPAVGESRKGTLILVKIRAGVGLLHAGSPVPHRSVYNVAGSGISGVGMESVNCGQGNSTSTSENRGSSQHQPEIGLPLTN